MNIAAWKLVDAELTYLGKDWQWLYDKLGYRRQRVHNWHQRGIPSKEWLPVALAMGESMDWIAGLAPPRRKNPDSLSPMALRIAREFDKIADPERQLEAFAAAISAIARVRGT